MQFSASAATMPAARHGRPASYASRPWRSGACTSQPSLASSRCGFSWQGAALAIGSYFVRMFVVTAAYHRYFAHRAFKTSRWFQFLLALGAQTAAQKGVLWWASHHRRHHKHSDTPQDVHSAQLRGFWYSHIGWILGTKSEETDRVAGQGSGEVSRAARARPTRAEMLPPVAAGARHALARRRALRWCGASSSRRCCCWHGTFTINSLSHLFGKRRYATTDDSRNNFALALLTMGEGWHNNHHHYQSSANQGFLWWEIDLTYYVLRVLALFGLVWDLRRPPREVVAATRRRPRSTADSPSRRSAAYLAK